MTCKLGLPKLFAYTMFQSGDLEERCLYTYQYFVLAYFSEVFWLYMALCLNTCLCVDLILMIKYPFVRKEKFMNWYLTVAILASLIVAVRMRWFIDGGKLYIKENVLFLASYTIFVIVAITSSVLAYNYLS